MRKKTLIVAILVILGSLALAGAHSRPVEACSQAGCPPTPCLNSGICLGSCVCLKTGSGGLGQCVQINALPEN